MNKLGTTFLIGLCIAVFGCEGKSKSKAKSIAPSKKGAGNVEVSADTKDASGRSAQKLPDVIQSIIKGPTLSDPVPAPPVAVAPAIPKSQLGWDGKALIGTETMALVPLE